MNECIAIALIDIVLFVGCDNSSTTKPEAPFKALPVYNQAYQENYSADSINEILNHAKGAYVVVDALEDDIGPFIKQIKAKGNQIAGYISVGTGENYRADFDVLRPYLTATAWPEWPDEFFVSETTTGIVPLMKNRIDKIVAWGVDWMEFDNIDWLTEETRQRYNLMATEVEAKRYINGLCDYAHTKGIKCMAKNTVDGFENFDGVLYESFHNEKNWWDTEGTQSFLNAGKLVIVTHYNETDCDAVYEEYKSFYKSDNISFICEEISTQKYKHYN